MTTRPLVNRVADLAYTSPQIGRTVRGPWMMGAAETANVVALARPSRGFNLYTLAPGTYTASYRRTHDSIRQAVIAWTTRTVPPPGTSITAGDSLSVELTITDALGNSVGPSDSRIPQYFRGEARSYIEWSTGHPGLPDAGGSGILDLDALAVDLVDPSWSFEFVVARPTGTLLFVDLIHMRELARSIVDTSETYGCDPADYQPGQPIAAGSVSTLGTERLAKTIEGAIAATPDVLVLGWVDDTSATIPKTTSATYAALTNLTQSGTTPMRWRVPVRPMLVAAPPGDATGETGRWRVRYSVSGGGTADVQLLTGSSGSPYAITGLTGGTWQWSAWQDCRLPTDATDQIAALSLKARTSAGTVYISGVHVQQT